MHQGGISMFRLYELNGQVREFPNEITPLDVIVSGIQKERETEIIESVPGVIDYGIRDAYRNINLRMFFRLETPEQFGYFRNKIDDLFKGYFFIEEKRLPDRVYKVVVPSPIVIERYERNDIEGEITVNCEMYSLPYAESKEPVEIAASGSQYTIYSDGSQAIEPYHQYLQFELSNIQGSSSYVELVNITNGSRFRITEALGSNMVVDVMGVTVRINNAQALRRTTRVFLSLDPGINKIELNGANSADIKVTYKNYYR